MNVLIISDSHGLEEELQTIAKRHEAEVDTVKVAVCDQYFS